MMFLMANPLHATEVSASEQTETSATSPYKIPASITVEKLIQKVYANSPLNASVLRKALVDANPKVITGNPQQRVKSGTVVMVPDHSEVVRVTLTPLSATAKDAQDNNPSARDFQARKQWVRFP